MSIHHATLSAANRVPEIRCCRKAAVKSWVCCLTLCPVHSSYCRNSKFIKRPGKFLLMFKSLMNICKSHFKQVELVFPLDLCRFGSLLCACILLWHFMILPLSTWHFLGHYQHHHNTKAEYFLLPHLQADSNFL